jgi:hypothetical protein
MDRDKKEIGELIKQQRGRRPPAHEAAHKQHVERVQKIEQLLSRGTEEELLDWLFTEAGIQPDSPEAQRVLRVWRENRRA